MTGPIARTIGKSENIDSSRMNVEKPTSRNTYVLLASNEKDMFILFSPDRNFSDSFSFSLLQSIDGDAIKGIINSYNTANMSETVAFSRISLPSNLIVEDGDIYVSETTCCLTESMNYYTVNNLLSSHPSKAAGTILRFDGQTYVSTGTYLLRVDT